MSSYRTTLDLASNLSDAEKLKLAYHLLGQLLLAPNQNTTPKISLPPSVDYDYCLERVLKSKPNRLPALRTFLEAIFSFRGGQNTDVDNIIKYLETHHVIKVDKDAITYLVD